jgi:hypothetical protein
METIYSNLGGKFNAECPEGYYRSSFCADPSDPSFNETLFACGYPIQINCYSTLNGDTIPPETVASTYAPGYECVSYCDNV